MDKIVRFLIPPSVREEISGDLFERYKSKGQYTKDVALILPYILASQIRRNTNIPILGIQAFLLFFCFGGFVALSDAAAIDVPRWLRAAVPTLLALTVLLLRDGFRAAEHRPVSGAGVDVLSVVLIVLLSQAMLLTLSAAALSSPDWVLSSRRAIVAVAGLPMLFCLRLAAHYKLPVLAGEISEDALNRDFDRFRSGVLWRNRAIALGGILGASVAVRYFLGAASVASQIGWALGIAGGLAVVGYVFSKTSVRAKPADMSFSSSLAFYRRELERQSNTLPKVWWWYLLSIIPAMVGGVVGARADESQRVLYSLTPMQLGAYFAICVLVGLLYMQYARSFQTRFERLASVRERSPS
jgi:hypothetical protein